MGCRSSTVLTGSSGRLRRNAERLVRIKRLGQVVRLGRQRPAYPFFMATPPSPTCDIVGDIGAAPLPARREMFFAANNA
jgi:hypothetical protein